MKIVFFDVETTGLPISWKESYSNIYNWPYIIQLAYIVSYHENEISLEWDTILKPDGFEISSESTKVHSISNEQALTEGCNRKETLKNFASIIVDADYVVAHNANFDINVLRCEFLRNNIVDPFQKGLPIICTMKRSTSFCKLPSEYGDYKWPSLQELHYKLFEKHFSDEHNAKQDVRATYECFWELFKQNIINVDIKESKILLSKGQEKLKDIISENYNVFLILLSYYYPFTGEELNKFKGFLDWDYISQNKNIKWTVDLITKFKDRIVISKEYSVSGPNFDDEYNEGLNYNSAISNNFDIIDSFSDEWENYNSLFDFNKSKTIYYILDKYYNDIDFNVLSFERVQWPKIILRRFKNDFNWSKLSKFGVLDEESIDEFKPLIDWQALSKNHLIDFSIELLEKYKDKWNWSCLVRNNANRISYEFLSTFKEYLNWETISYYIENANLTIEQFDEFKDSLDWKIISKQYPLSYDFLKYYYNQLNWDSIHINPNIHWTVETINKLENKLDINRLNLINSVWTSQLIEKYKSYLTENLDKKGDFYGDKNYPISWTELSDGGINYSRKYYRFHKIKVLYSLNLIKEYEEFWNWNLLSSNQEVNWSIDMIREFKNKLNFKNLSENESIEWSNELITEFSDYWDFDTLLNNKKIIESKYLIGDYDFKIHSEKIDTIEDYKEIHNFKKDLNSPISLIEKSFENSPLFKVNSLLKGKFLDHLVRNENKMKKEWIGKTDRMP